MLEIDIFNNNLKFIGSLRVWESRWCPDALLAKTMTSYVCVHPHPHEHKTYLLPLYTVIRVVSSQRSCDACVPETRNNLPPPQTPRRI